MENPCCLPFLYAKIGTSGGEADEERAEETNMDTGAETRNRK